MESGEENVSRIFSSVGKGEDGIWWSSACSEVSYPDNGSSLCYEVESGSYWFRHRNACIGALVSAVQPNLNGAFCDIGGGNGFVSIALQNSGYDVFLVEPSAEGARNAKMRGVRNVVCSTTEDAGLRNESIAAIGAFDVIEHIEDAAGFITGLRNALVPGGVLYATVPAFQWLWSEEDNLAGHFRRYTLASLRKLFIEQGFEVVYASYLFWCLPIPIWLMRSIPYYFGVRRGGYDAQRMAREHGSGDSVVSRVVSSILGFEVPMVRQMRRIPIGSSCLFAARRQV